MFLISFSVFLRNEWERVATPTVKWLCNWIHDFMCAKRLPHKYTRSKFLSFSPPLRPVCRRRRPPPWDAITILLSELFQRCRTSNNHTFYSLLYSFHSFVFGHCLFWVILAGIAFVCRRLLSTLTANRIPLSSTRTLRHPHSNSFNAHPYQHHWQWGRKKICLWHLTCADMMQTERPKKRSLRLFHIVSFGCLATMAMTMTCFFYDFGILSSAWCERKFLWLIIFSKVLTYICCGVWRTRARARTARNNGKSNGIG